MLILSHARKVHVCGMCKCTQMQCGVHTSRRSQGIVIASKRNLRNFGIKRKITVHPSPMLATTHMLMSAMLKRNLMKWKMGTISILLLDQLVRLLHWILRTVDSLFAKRVSWDVFLGLLIQILCANDL